MYKMNKINAVYTSLAALVVAVIALVVCLVCCNKESANVEEVLNEKPELVINAMQNYEQKMREDAQKKAQQMIEENSEALNNNPNDGVIANPDGKIVLVEFFDFSCGYCHRIYPAIKAIAAKNPDVKVVAKSLTFVAPISNYAAKAALAAKNQGKYAEMYTAMFENKGPLTEAKIDELAVANGLDLEKLKADMDSDLVKNTLNETSELAGKIQVNGVPTLVLNGKIVQTLDEAVIQSEIDAAKK